MADTAASGTSSTSAGGGKTAAIAEAAGKLIGSLVNSFMANKTQKDFNKAQIKILEEDNRINLLSASEKAVLDFEVANAKTDTERIKVYEDTLAKYGIATINSTASMFKSKIDGTKQTLIILGFGTVLIIGTVFLLRKK
jgi:hypothetical protein